jgi:hypothetical protein
MPTVIAFAFAAADAVRKRKPRDPWTPFTTAETAHAEELYRGAGMTEAEIDVLLPERVR